MILCLQVTHLDTLPRSFQYFRFLVENETYSNGQIQYQTFERSFDAAKVLFVCFFLRGFDKTLITYRT